MRSLQGAQNIQKRDIVKILIFRKTWLSRNREKPKIKVTDKSASRLRC